MRLDRPAFLARLLGCLGAGAVLVPAVTQSCVFPTERSAELKVVMDPIPDLLRGDVSQLKAAVVDQDGTALPNADVLFESDNPLVITVDPGGRLIASRPGTGRVLATAIGFADAAAAEQDVRVRDLLEVDSIRPREVRYGDTLLIFGIGLNPRRLLQVTLGGIETAIKHFEPLDPPDSNRAGVLTVWVPAPLQPWVNARVLGIDGIAESADSTRVVPIDIFEPNDTVPWDFGTISAPIRNPGLAFEPLASGEDTGADWYRFTIAAPSDLSILVRGGSQAGVFRTRFADLLSWDPVAQSFALGTGAWQVGDRWACADLVRTSLLAPPDSVLFAFRSLPAGTYDLVNEYDEPGGYSLEITAGYRSQLPPDDAEENDICEWAAPLTLNTELALTIDNPGDLDWFSFSLEERASVRFLVEAEVEDSDPEWLVMVDARPDSVRVLFGPPDRIMLPGKYLLVVTESLGVATPYTLTAAVRPFTPPVRDAAARATAVFPAERSRPVR